MTVDANDHFANIREVVGIVFNAVYSHLSENVGFENSIFGEAL